MNSGKRPVYAAVLFAAVILLVSCKTVGFSESATSAGESAVTTQIEESGVTPAKPEETPDLTLSDRKLGSADTVNTVSGSWSWKNGILTGSNASVGNCYAMTELYAAEGESFEIESKISITAGSGGGIVFGVKKDKFPSAAWYCVNINKSSKNTRLFSVGVGTVGTSSAAQRALTSKELEKNIFTLKISVTEEGKISFWLDGGFVASYTEPDFAGGYIGFNSYYSDIRFYDIVYRIGSMKNQLSSLSLTSGGEKIELTPGAYVYSVDLKEGSDTVLLKLGLPEGCSASVNSENIGTGSASYSFKPAYGESRWTVSLAHPDYGKTSFVLILWRDIPDNLKYTDTYRPQYHFSPAMNYMNDPNGLVYNETTGEYHLFYQYNPSGLTIGNQVWGHAVSEDLINWREVGIAIDRNPDGGRIYSGSCVIDYNNTSGFFDSSVPPASRMVAIYTVNAATYLHQTQNIAYSLDNGYTWIKYSGNPVIPSSSYGEGFRDPKVMWIEDSSKPNGGIWLMVVAGGVAQLFTSDDLVHWTFNSVICDINGKIVESECPDIFKLPLDGDKTNIKYVYSGAGRFYIVGNIIKNKSGMYEFKAEQAQVDNCFYSNRAYATQSYFNDPNGRLITISWLRDTTSAGLDGKYWNGVQSLPYETRLVTEAGGMMKLCSLPVKEVENLFVKALYEAEGLSLTAGKTLLTDVHSKEYMLQMKIKASEGNAFELRLRKGGEEYTSVSCVILSDLTARITVSTIKSGAVAGSSWTVTVSPDSDGTLNLTVFIDNTVLEVFAGSGQAVFSDLIFPSPDSDGMTYTVNSGTQNIISLKCYEMMSIWN
jgi:sucrose-6-phosphate hydrolase SacC (GH32 family)